MFNLTCLGAEDAEAAVPEAAGDDKTVVGRHQIGGLGHFKPLVKVVTKITTMESRLQYWSHTPHVTDHGVY
jgi:hypothetical protein